MMELNPNQKLAIEAEDKKLLIIASAGAGKTLVLIEKAASIIVDKGNNPKSVLMLTFSNKAAKQMKERLLDRIGPKSREVTISTFHAFALKLLKQFHDYTELGKFFKVIDEEDRNRFLATIANELKISKASLREYKEKLTKFNEGLIEIPPDFNELHSKKKLKLEEMYMVEMSELIPRANKLINENADVLKFLQEYYKYVLIDEYQDINFQQHSFIEPLIKNALQFVAVGDDDQCIYEWRGSKPEIMRSLASQMDVRKISLSQNYRSQINVTEIANLIIVNNINRIDKKMISEISGSPLPLFMEYKDRNEEARDIAYKIQSILNSTSTQYKEIAVLLRNVDQSPNLILELSKLKIPFINHNSNLKKSKLLLNYLREISIEDPEWSKLINFPKNFDKFVIEDKVKEYQLTHLTPNQVVHEIYKLNLEFQDSTIFRSRYETIASLLSIKEELLNQKKKILFAINFLYESLINSGDYLAESDNELFEIAMSIARDYSNLNETQSLSEFCDYLELVMEEITNSSEDGVQIMTVHKSKGLEFDTVFIPGIDAQNFPNSIHIRNKSDLESERRLLYVGITRSKNKLFLSSGRVGSDDSIIFDGFVTEIKAAFKVLLNQAKPVNHDNQIKTIDYNKKIDAKYFPVETRKLIFESNFSDLLNATLSKWTIEGFPLLSREVQILCDNVEVVIADILRHLEPSRAQLLSSRSLIYGTIKLILDQVLSKNSIKVSDYLKSESVYQKFELIELHQSLMDSGFVNKNFSLINLSNLNDYKNYLDSLHHKDEMSKRKNSKAIIEKFSASESDVKLSLVLSPVIFLDSVMNNKLELKLIESSLRI